jgi:hypothetical protein
MAGAIYEYRPWTRLGPSPERRAYFVSTINTPQSPLVYLLACAPWKSGPIASTHAHEMREVAQITLSQMRHRTVRRSVDVMQRFSTWHRREGHQQPFISASLCLTGSATTVTTRAFDGDIDVDSSEHDG